MQRGWGLPRGVRRWREPRRAPASRRRNHAPGLRFPKQVSTAVRGAPVCRLRFGIGTRLYYFNLPLHHELDPRSSRLPLKVHAVLRREHGAWVTASGERLVEELAADPRTPGERTG